MTEISHNEQLVCPVNYQLSFIREKIVYKLTLGSVFNYIIDFGVGLIFIGMANFPIWGLVATVNAPRFLIVFSILFDAWMAANFICRDRFVKIKGNNMESNKKRMFELLETEYPKIDFYEAEANVIRGIKLTGFSWGRIITVLFKEETILLNITKIGKTESPTAIHGWACYLKSKALAKKVSYSMPIQ